MYSLSPEWLLLRVGGRLCPSGASYITSTRGGSSQSSDSKVPGKGSVRELWPAGLAQRARGRPWGLPLCASDLPSEGLFGEVSIHPRAHPGDCPADKGLSCKEEVDPSFQRNNHNRESLGPFSDATVLTPSHSLFKEGLEAQVFSFVVV